MPPIGRLPHCEAVLNPRAVAAREESRRARILRAPTPFPEASAATDDGLVTIAIGRPERNDRADLQSAYRLTAARSARRACTPSSGAQPASFADVLLVLVTRSCFTVRSAIAGLVAGRRSDVVGCRRKRLVGQVWRRGVVLDVPADHAGVVPAVQLADEPSRHVDSGGDALARHQIAVDDITGVTNDSDVASVLKSVFEGMMGGNPTAAGQPHAGARRRCSR